MNRTMRRRPRSRNGSRGQALVEFAFVFPLFVVLLFGLIDVGRFVFVYNSVAQAAREGARVGAVAGWVQECPASTRSLCIESTTLGRMAGVPGSKVDSSCTRRTGTGDQVLSADACRAGDRLIVTVTTSYTMLTPVIAQLLGDKELVVSTEVVVNS